MYKIKFTEAELAVIYDSLFHVESTTDAYSNPYNSKGKESYTEAFRNAFDKIQSVSNKNIRKGAFYFE